MEYCDEKQFENITLSEGVIVSDPCYTRSQWCCNGVIITPGEYETKLFYSDENEWGKRVAKLGVYRVGALPVAVIEQASFMVGVDSGQAGIFCDSLYPVGVENNGVYGDLTTFYGRACYATIGLGYEDLNKRQHAEEEVSYYTEEMSKFNEKKAKGIDTEKDRNEAIYFEKMLERHKERLQQDIIPYYQGGTLDGKGFVSSSGFGDGDYSCEIGKADDGSTCFIEIIFIDDADDEEIMDDEEMVDEADDTKK